MTYKCMNIIHYIKPATYPPAASEVCGYDSIQSVSRLLSENRKNKAQYIMTTATISLEFKKGLASTISIEEMRSPQHLMFNTHHFFIIIYPSNVLTLTWLFQIIRFFHTLQIQLVWDRVSMLTTWKLLKYVLSFIKYYVIWCHTCHHPCC